MACWEFWCSDHPCFSPERQFHIRRVKLLELQASAILSLSTQVTEWDCHWKKWLLLYPPPALGIWFRDFALRGEADSKTDSPLCLPKGTDFICDRKWRNSSQRALSRTVEILERQLEGSSKYRLNCSPGHFYKRELRNEMTGRSSLGLRTISNADPRNYFFKGTRFD